MWFEVKPGIGFSRHLWKLFVQWWLGLLAKAKLTYIFFYFVFMTKLISRPICSDSSSPAGLMVGIWFVNLRNRHATSLYGRLVKNNISLDPVFDLRRELVQNCSNCPTGLCRSDCLYLLSASRIHITLPVDRSVAADVETYHNPWNCIWDFIRSSSLP